MAGDKYQSEKALFLNGDWSFRYYDSLRKMDLDLEQPLDISDFDTLPVPSVWQCHGYDHHQYTNIRYPFPYDPPFVPADNPCGVYHKSFQLDKKGRGALLPQL